MTFLVLCPSCQVQPTQDYVQTATAIPQAHAVATLMHIWCLAGLIFVGHVHTIMMPSSTIAKAKEMMKRAKLTSPVRTSHGRATSHS